MTRAEDVRDVIAKADGLRLRASALDRIIVRMRINEPVTQKRGHFFSKARGQEYPEVHLTGQEDRMFYEWANEKMREYQREADRLDKSLKVVPE